MKQKKDKILIREVWEFLKIRKAWWLLPLIIMTLLMGILVIFTSTSKASIFIYALI